MFARHSRGRSRPVMIQSETGTCSSNQSLRLRVVEMLMLETETVLVFFR